MLQIFIAALSCKDYIFYKVLTIFYLLHNIATFKALKTAGF